MKEYNKHALLLALVVLFRGIAFFIIGVCLDYHTIQFWIVLSMTICINWLGYYEAKLITNNSE